jgi:type III restriction enzyme
MKLKFKQQAYQSDAAMAVVDCFTGQSHGYRKETISKYSLTREEMFANKKLELNVEELLANLQEVQKRQGNLKISNKLDGLNFTIEMETGTGKTYVYTKTIFELNKQYGWSKFIIIVPSIAIREGVHKSLEITANHFYETYGKKIRFSIYDTKSKSNIPNIKNFASTSNIEVFIMNYQAFATKSKDSRKIYEKLDQTASVAPIDIIKKSHPILIIDEPQRFGQQAEALLPEFNPLFILRYSATHKKEYNKVYSLDAIDAYNHKLVKKINVRGIEVVGNSGTNSYLFLDAINISTNQYPTANLELEIKQKSGIKKDIRKVSERDDLFQLSGELTQYKGFVVKEINGLKNKVSFTNGVELYVGQSVGEVDEMQVRRIQIRETIRAHLEKEKQMFSKGIKVLSLFFIDEVAKYRVYDKNDNQDRGEYARIFEEEYALAVGQQSFLDKEYQDYLNQHPVDKIHDGYFSVDKKGKFVDSNEKRGEAGSDDVSAYELIMKRKEQLLSFKEPIRFIFSHSALREGWDNPNVFQICTLKHSQSDVSKRQEIGRGLRICVNEHGERMDATVLDNEFFKYNTLTVVASESYDKFAKELQEEIIKALPNRPVSLTTEVLINRVISNNKGDKFTFTSQSAMDLIFKFREKGYVDENYKITEILIKDIQNDTVALPKELEKFKTQVVEMMQSMYDTANFQACANEKAENIHEVILKPNDNFARQEFQDLWKRLKIKTVYEVDFDSSELVQKSIAAIEQDLTVKKVKITITEGEQKEKMTDLELKAKQSMTKGKTSTEQAGSLLGDVKYDLIGEITKETRLTRRTVVNILQGLKESTFYNFRVNPEDFIKQVTRIIDEQKATTLINSIRYSKTDQVYKDDIFTINSFQGTLGKNILEVKKHIYDYLKYDSKTIEANFAKDLEAGEVLVYAKLPNGFKIPTPVGNYNPDWAIVFDTKKVKYVYFIAETKGSMSSLQWRDSEESKIEYARRHFESLEDASVKYDVITNYQDLMDKVLV